MDVLALSAELMRRSDELRARSARARAAAAKRSAAADEKVVKSRRLIATAAETRQGGDARPRPGAGRTQGAIRSR
jgi:hypothetical protein